MYVHICIYSRYTEFDNNYKMYREAAVIIIITYIVTKILVNPELRKHSINLKLRKVFTIILRINASKNISLCKRTSALPNIVIIIIL